MKTSVPLGLAIAHLALLVGLVACSRAPHPVQPELLPSAPVRTLTLTTGAHLANEEVVGTVRAKLRAVIEAKVSGRVDQMRVVPGQRVQAGELLAELDAREVRARLDQAVAMRAQADSDLQRSTNLLRQEAVTRAEFDAVQARQRVAQAAVVEAETLLGYTRITAPFGGVITRKLADLGDLASPGKALLEIEDPGQLRLEANVPEALISRLVNGARLRVRVGSVDRDLAGTVTEISPAADPGSRTFLVRLDLPPEPGLRAGQFGRAYVPLGELAAIRVPARAVVQRGQMELVFVVATNHAQLRLVKTGKRWGDEVELLAGADVGEAVVIDGASSLRDGQPVELVKQ